MLIKECTQNWTNQIWWIVATIHPLCSHKILLSLFIQKILLSLFIVATIHPSCCHKTIVIEIRTFCIECISMENLNIENEKFE